MALPQSLNQLRTRLFLVVALCLIPTFAVVLWQGIENKRRLDSNLRREAVSLAHEIAAYPKDVIPDPRVFLANLAERPEFIAGGEACDTLTAAIVKSNRYITNVKVISTGGKELCSGLHHGESANLAERSYFKRAIASRSFAIGDHLIGQRTKKHTIGFAHPILDTTKNISGVVSIGIDLD